MSSPRYERLNNYVMGVVYSPLLLVTAWLETKQAHKVKWNRRNGESDEDETQEWEQMGGELDLEAEGWTKKVESTRPDVQTDVAVLEVRALREQVEELKKIVEGKAKGDGSGNGKGDADGGA